MKEYLGNKWTSEGRTRVEGQYGDNISINDDDFPSCQF